MVIDRLDVYHEEGIILGVNLPVKNDDGTIVNMVIPVIVDDNRMSRGERIHFSEWCKAQHDRTLDRAVDEMPPAKPRKV